MRNRNTTKGHTGSGSVMIEFTIAFPLVLFMAFAVIQLAHIWIARHVVSYAAYMAARSALVSVPCRIERSTENDSLPGANEVEFPGYGYGTPPPGQITEADYIASRTAARICALVVTGEKPSQQGRRLYMPGWGTLSGTGAHEVKTRAWVVEDPDEWEVTATVEFDFGLIMPIVGPAIGWGMNLWSDEEELHPDSTDNVHLDEETDWYPHLRIVDSVTLPKPYRTAVACGNWEGT